MSRVACPRCTHRLCADCRLLHIRQLAKDRQRRRRAAVEYADELPPLLAMMLFFTEDTAWIERKLAEEDRQRRARPASRC